MNNATPPITREQMIAWLNAGRNARCAETEQPIVDAILAHLRTPTDASTEKLREALQEIASFEPAAGVELLSSQVRIMSQRAANALSLPSVGNARGSDDALTKAWDDAELLCEYSYQNGFHELGYDPLSVIEQALKQALSPPAQSPDAAGELTESEREAIEAGAKALGRLHSSWHPLSQHAATLRRLANKGNEVKP